MRCCTCLRRWQRAPPNAVRFRRALCGGCDRSAPVNSKSGKRRAFCRSGDGTVVSRRYWYVHSTQRGPLRGYSAAPWRALRGLAARPSAGSGENGSTRLAIQALCTPGGKLAQHTSGSAGVEVGLPRRRRHGLGWQRS